jgi:hypothetical protein
VDAANDSAGGLVRQTKCFSAISAIDNEHNVPPLWGEVKALHRFPGNGIRGDTQGTARSTVNPEQQAHLRIPKPLGQGIVG